MANKRQRKKQQAKRNASILKRAGLPKKEIKHLKNKPPKLIERLPEVKTYHKKQKQVERNERARHRADYLRTLTKDKDLISRMRYWGEERYREEVKRLEEKKKRRDQREARQRRLAGQKKLVMLWKDKTEFNDESFIMDVKRDYSRLSIPELIETINGLSQIDFGAIGDYQLTITKDARETISYYRDEYIPVYSGTASNYQKLLVGAAVVVLGMYQQFEKDMFLRDLAFYVNELHPKNAHRLVNDFHLQ